MTSMLIKAIVFLSIAQISYCQGSDKKPTNGNGCTNWGKSYPDQTEICIKGNLNRCDSGTWKDLGTKCVDTKPSCEHNGKGYPENYKACFDGTIHQCEVGSWNDLGTKCSNK